MSNARKALSEQDLSANWLISIVVWDRSWPTHPKLIIGPSDGKRETGLSCFLFFLLCCEGGGVTPLLKESAKASIHQGSTVLRAIPYPPSPCFPNNASALLRPLETSGGGEAGIVSLSPRDRGKQPTTF